jgi:hypothetical protein
MVKGWFLFNFRKKTLALTAEPNSLPSLQNKNLEKIPR